MLGVLLIASEKTMLQECQLPIEDDAVYCCVKTYMRDTHLQQEPHHCVKAAQARRVWALSPAPTAIVPRGQRSEEEIKNITVLADACKHELGLPDAGAVLEALLTDRRVSLPCLTWLETLTRDNVVETLRPRLRNPYFPHLPEVSWRLAAEVKRSARGCGWGVAGGQLALHVCAAVQQCSCDMTANHSSAAECLCSCVAVQLPCKIHVVPSSGGWGG